MEAKFIKDIVLQIIKDIFSQIVSWRKARKIRNSKREKDILKVRIRKFFERGQEKVHGSFSATEDDVLQIFENEDPALVREALNELVNNYLEFQDGRYYLKGHAPQYD